MTKRIPLLAISYVTALLVCGGARAQLVEPGDLVVTDLFGLAAPDLSVIDPNGGTTSFDLLSCGPFDVDVDASGRIFVSTGFSGTIFRVDPGAASDCIAVGLTTSAALGIGFGTNGLLYVIDSGQVFELDPVAYSPGDPTANRTLVGSGGSLSGARDVALGTGGRLFVATTAGPVVRVDPTAYDPGDPPSNQSVVGLGGVAEDRDIAVSAAGELFVAEVVAAGSRVVRYDPLTYDPMDATANQIAVYSGGNISLPATVVVDDGGNLLVLDGVGVISIDVASGSQLLVSAGTFGVPFAKLAVAPPSLSVPALAPNQVVMLTLLLLAGGWCALGAVSRHDPL